MDQVTGHGQPVVLRPRILCRALTGVRGAAQRGFCFFEEIAASAYTTLFEEIAASAYTTPRHSLKLRKEHFLELETSGMQMARIDEHGHMQMRGISVLC